MTPSTMCYETIMSTHVFSRQLYLRISIYLLHYTRFTFSLAIITVSTDHQPVSHQASHHLLWSAEGDLCLSTDLLYGRCVWSLVLSPHLAIIPNICSPHNLVPKQQLVKVETRTIASISQAELWADWESGGVITILQPLAMLFVGIYKRYINWQRPCDYFRPTPFMWTLVLLCSTGELICWAIHQRDFQCLFVNWCKGAQVDNANWIKLINMICIVFRAIMNHNLFCYPGMDSHGKLSSKMSNTKRM